MDTGVFYQPLYLIALTILTYIMMSRYREVEKFPQEYEDLDMIKLALGLIGILIVIIGFRPPTSGYFGDTYNYYSWYKVFGYGKPFTWNWEEENFIFDNIYGFFASLRIPIDYFFLLISFLYFGGILWACKKLFPQDTMLTLLVYLGAFSTFSYGTNGIKAGAAASLFLLAIAYRDSLWKTAVFLVLSLGFHHSMTLPIGAFILASFLRDRRYYYAIWVFSLIMAALQITFFQELFSGMTDEHGAKYLMVTTKARPVSGFRPDFIIYSFVPIFLGDHIMRKYEIESKKYDFLWNVYTLTNAIFLLCTYGEFINRIAYLSWIIYPFVLIYPFLSFQWHPNQNRFLRYAVYGHLGFTLFMTFVYYGI